MRVGMCEWMVCEKSSFTYFSLSDTISTRYNTFGTCTSENARKILSLKISSQV